MTDTTTRPRAKLRISAAPHVIHTVIIDGHAIEVRCARVHGEPLSELMHGFRRMYSRPSAALRSYRIAPEERETTPDGAFVISDEEIQRRRLAELTPEQRAEYERYREDEEQHARAFVTKMIEQHVSVLPGQIEIEDLATGESRDVTTGAELVDLYGARPDVMTALLGAIMLAQTPQVIPAAPESAASDPSPAIATAAE